MFCIGKIHNENSKNFDKGYVGKVVQDWEATISNLPKNVQRIILRIGLVLGKNAKTITNLRFPFKMGLGEASVLLTDGAQVEPENLLEAGFEFEYPSIERALKEIIE